jgi:hypothetical protein
MDQQDYEAAVTAFMRTKGVTRCPTVCASPTQASINEADRSILRRINEDREAQREQRKLRKIAIYRFGKAA